MKIGFVSDIHEDILSLESAFSALDQRGCDAVVCLGDIVGFTLPFQKNIAQRDANACVQLVSERCAVVVAGNHDLFAVRRTPVFAAGFHYGDDWYGMDYERRAKLARNKIWLYEDSELPHRLTERSMELLRALPEYRITSFDGVRMLISHFHYPDLSGSTIRLPRRAAHLAEHFQFMSAHECSVSVSGHGHPEGFVRGGRKMFQYQEFGSATLGDDLQWLVCPCVANTSRKNGVMVFDTQSRHVEAIALGSRKKHV